LTVLSALNLVITVRERNDVAVVTAADP
jgi:hypothetical protein